MTSPDLLKPESLLYICNDLGLLTLERKFYAFIEKNRGGSGTVIFPSKTFSKIHLPVHRQHTKRIEGDGDVDGNPLAA